MKVAQEFSRYASYYGTYNVIQNRVVDKLIAGMTTHPKRILDLGCGNGAVFKAIDWSLDQFVGVDFAPGMLSEHPKDVMITCMQGDFNTPELFETLESYRFDHIISASALQWATSLEAVCEALRRFEVPLSLALFTCKTFDTLYKTAGLEPILRCSDEIETIFKRFFKPEFERVTYELEFDSKRELFRYIKRSGVSGGRNVLGYKEMKALMARYPHRTLEFEVLYIHT